MTDIDKGSPHIPEVIQLVPKHDAVFYLQTVPGLEPEQLGFIVSLVNQTSDQNVSKLFGGLYKLSEIQLDPTCFETQNNFWIEYNLRLHSRMRERFASEGKNLDDLTQDDIRPAELNLESVRMSTDEYRDQFARRLLVARDRDIKEIKEEFLTALDLLRERISPEDYEKLMQMLSVSIDGDQIEISGMSDEQLLAHTLLLGGIAKRLSPIWRKAVSENPWADPELVVLMRVKGEEILDHDLIVEAIRKKDERRVVRSLIADGLLPRDEVRSVVNRLLVDREVDDFLRRRIGQMMEEETIPYAGIAEILRFVG